MEVLERRVVLTTAVEPDPSAAIALSRLPSIDLPDQPFSVAIEADFNGDGIMDLLKGTENGLALFLIPGSENEPVSQQEYASGAVQNVVAEDVDGDAFVDVVVSTTSEILFFANNGGSGSTWLGLSEPTVISTESGTPYAKDVTGDGSIDLIVDRNVRFDVLHGLGNGEFGAPVSFLTGGQNAARAFALGDVNQDGAIDVVAHSRQQEQFHVLVNDGTGLFETEFTPVLVEAAGLATLADLNQDDVLDLIFTRGEVIEVRAGLSGGGFTDSQFSVAVTSSISEIQATDVNGDGLTDLITRERSLFHDPILGNITGGISVVLGTVDGELAPAVRVSNGPWFAMAVSDVDGHIHAYGFAANQRLDIQQHSLFSLGPDAYTPYGRDRHATTFVDANRDGLLDVVTASTKFRTQDSVTLLVADGDGGFLSADTLDLDFAPSALLPPRPDAGQELAIAGHKTDGSAVLATVELTEEGQFGAARTTAIDFSDQIAAADINRDGITDFVGLADEALQVWLDAPGGFVTGDRLAFSGTYQSDEIVDIDNDGKLDVIIHAADPTPEDPTRGLIHAYIGNGDGTFSAIAPIVIHGSTFATMDVEDGSSRLVTVDGTDLRITRISDGVTTVDDVVPAGHAVLSLLVRDLDGDEKSDLLARTAGDRLVILRADGGGFLPPETHPLNHRLSELLVEDWTGDGRPDLLAIGYGNTRADTGAFNSGTPSVEVSLFVGQPTRFTASKQYVIALSNGAVAGTSDLDHNGLHDVLFAGANGIRIWRPDRLRGDVSRDGRVDQSDVDLLTQAMRQPPTDNEPFDLSEDGEIDEADLTILVEEVLNTRFGDVNLDGRVDFTDFLRLSANFGALDAKWDDGDVNGDATVDFADFLQLARSFGFSR